MNADLQICKINLLQDILIKQLHDNLNIPVRHRYLLPLQFYRYSTSATQNIFIGQNQKFPRKYFPSQIKVKRSISINSETFHMLLNIKAKICWIKNTFLYIRIFKKKRRGQSSAFLSSGKLAEMSWESSSRQRFSCSRRFFSLCRLLGLKSKSSRLASPCSSRLESDMRRPAWVGGQQRLLAALYRTMNCPLEQQQHYFCGLQ